MQFEHLTALESKREVLVGKVKNIRWFTEDLIPNRNYFVCRVGTDVVGMIQYVEKSGLNPSALGIGFVMVDPAFNGRGIARRLISMLIQHTAKNGKKLRPGRFTKDGALRVKPVIERLAAKHNVPLI